MKRYMLLHCGFEPPTPEIMAAWNQWFAAHDDKMEENGGFHATAREISSGGEKDLPMDADAITGFSIIKAESLAEAEAIARDNPYIGSIRLYEIVSQ